MLTAYKFLTGYKFLTRCKLMWQMVQQCLINLRLINLQQPLIQLKRLWVTLSKLVVAVGLYAIIWFQSAAVYAQPAPAPKPPLLKQATDGSAPQTMTDAEKAQLNDPFFNVVLKNNTDAKSLKNVLQILNPREQKIFVVDEQIVDTAPKIGNTPASRRAIVSMKGTTSGQVLDDNVLFSVSFTSEKFPTPGFIEVMGWDEPGNRYNYYKLDQRGSETAPTWKFRGSSKDADTLALTARQGTCLACHINGGTVMKELLFPWNHWESFKAPTPYLVKGTNGWPVVNDPNSAFKDLGSAEVLESDTIFSTISRFNTGRIKALKSSDGRTITDARRLLKPLFVTTEFNMISSNELSPLHPFSKPTTASGDIGVPRSFFINEEVISNALNVASDFSFARLSAKDYEHLLRQTKTKLNDKMPGDTNFAWFVPEPSRIDTDFVRQLVDDNIVPAKFIAAAIAVDLETPVFSSARAKLWNSTILPAQFKIGAANDLTSQVIKNLETLNPAAGTPEATFLQLLKSPDPVAALKQRVDTYVSRERRLLGTGANPQDRSKEWIRLYKLALQRRESILADATLKSLDETGGRLLMARGDINATVAPLPSAATTSTPNTPTRPTLKLGDKGNDVVFLQQRLAALGFFDLNGSPDGDFGTQTRRAVMRAQTAFGLEADGVVGANTWTALLRA
jgi:hypothetical protein